MTEKKQRARRKPTIGVPAKEPLRPLTKPAGLWKLTLVVRPCIQPSCPRFHKPYRPEEEGRWALPHGEFGLEVIALIGMWRFREHRGVPEMHQALLPAPLLSRPTCENAIEEAPARRATD